MKKEGGVTPLILDSEELKWVRVFLLDELVFHNGKTLTPELIGEITGNVIDAFRVVKE